MFVKVRQRVIFIIRLGRMHVGRREGCEGVWRALL